MKRVLLAGLGAGVVVLLAACGSNKDDNSHNSTSTMAGMSGNASMSSGSTSMSSGTRSSGTGIPATGPHNAADVQFATDMIPHHGQAVTMADTALGKTSNTEIKQLATAIKNAQDPEIRTMSGWLTGWDKPVPSPSTQDVGGMSMPGMMSDADMANLDKATAGEFDRMWVTMMISHHTGAVTMAKAELADGQNADAKAVAQSIISGQTAEITTMKTLLNTLPS